MGVNRICLDTSAYCHFKRNSPEAVEIIGSADWIGVPTIVIGELMTGFRLGNRCQANRDELDQYLGFPIVHELPANRQVADCYAELVVSLRMAGSPIPTNDVWIAATCICSGSLLLTYDAHFAKIQRLGSIIL